MSDGDPQPLDQRSGVRAAGGLHVFQLSLMGVFVIVTVTALMVSVYFGVGRLVGMSTREVLLQGFSRLLFVMPTLLVWIIGVTMAIRRLKQNRVPARLTIIALSGLFLTTFFIQVVQMALIHAVSSNHISGEVMSWSFIFVAVLNSVVNAALWVLVLMAIFVQRPPDAPPQAHPANNLALNESARQRMP